MNYSLFVCHLDTLLNNHTVVHFQKIQIKQKILVSFYVARDLGWLNLFYYLVSVINLGWFNRNYSAILATL